ncbi:SMP-30/gluconolactonase/LRE family protein [Luteimonas rhizosphaericola]|uniref:SMP-30/gluconolactonase/LRE family protein n=1 Tax=Luteimonas rhizosphaericola TaxID=3042024 RepID=UPI002F4023F4
MRLLPTLLSAALAAALAACSPAAEDAGAEAAPADAATTDTAETETAPMTTFETVGQLTSFDPAFADVVDPAARIEKLTGDEFSWSEGPTWVKAGYLLFNDPPENRMFRWSEADGLSVFLDPSGHAGAPIEGVREAGANGLYTEAAGTVLVADSGNRLVARMDPADKSRTTLAERYDGKRFSSPNDVVARGDGSVFFTDPPYGFSDGDESSLKEQPVNGIYRIDADGAVHLVDDSLTRPNGLAFSPDGNTLYVANSDETRPIWMAYTLDAAGNVTGSRVFADATDLMGEGVHGLPDGLAVSTGGLVFATGPGGVLVMDAEGKRLGRIETGSAIANCAFGDNGRTLYMTSHKFLARVPLKVEGLGFQD